MLRAGRLLAAFFGCVLVVVATFAVDGVSHAQYPPPTPTPAPTKTPKPSDTPKPTKSPNPTKSPKPTKTPNPACSQVGTMSRGKFKAKTTFQPGAQIAVRGAKGCMPAGASTTTLLDPAGDTATIGASKAGKEGAYQNQGRLPQSASNGKHVVQTRGGGNRYSTAITVSTSSSANPARFLGSPGGLGLLVVLLALAAFAFVMAPRRRRRAALASSTGVPTIDTSHFVPHIKRDSKAPVRRRKASPPSE